jgi:hypothetical protein
MLIVLINSYFQNLDCLVHHHGFEVTLDSFNTEIYITAAKVKFKYNIACQDLSAAYQHNI